MKKISMGTFTYSFILLWVCAVGYGLGHTRSHQIIDLSQTIFNIATGLGVLALVLSTLTKSLEKSARESEEEEAEESLDKITEIREAGRDAYRNNEHLPLWLDVIFYLAKIGILGGTGNEGLAIIWVFLFKLDVQARIEATNKKVT